MKDEYLIGVLQLAEEEVNRKSQYYYKCLGAASYEDDAKQVGSELEMQRRYQMIYAQLNRTLADVIISKRMLESDRF